MVTLKAVPDLQQALALANQLLRAKDTGAADRLLTPLLEPFSHDPRLLHLTGTLRMHQQRFEEAAGLFARARAAEPREAVLAFSQGTALRWLERHDEAITAFRDATRLKPDYAEAYYEAATALQQAGDLAQAEAVLRQWLDALPDDARGTLALADLLLVRQQPREAQTILREGLQLIVPQQMRAALHQSLGLALYRQGKDGEALESYDRSAALNPDPATDAMRAEILQKLRRYEEAVQVSRGMVAREPANPQWHKLHNDLMYRLGNDDYLKSYERAPKTVDLLLSKAYFLSHQQRGEEAHQAYSQALAMDPDSRIAAIGVGNTLNMMKRHAEAQTLFDALLARHGDAPDLLSCAAEAAISAGDAEKAAALCEKNLALTPHDQEALSILGTAWRMIGDERDELLNGYDTLIQAFDLDPPDGFCDMESFNAELNDWLDRVHPTTGEFLGQSLRNGSQTSDTLFGRGHDLVERLQLRIREGIGRYIASMKEDDSHPLLSRRTRGFDYSGSWSSRLRDCGFHTNHIHPQGWISSCYYVALPPAVEDSKGRQGWIKFGEPALAVTIKEPIRRTIQPRPGRLVLFPSYMWHGTVPFRDTQPRTTIAFDVVPKG